MKKKVLILLLAAALFSTFAGCSKRVSSESPEHVVENSLNALKTLDEEAMKTYYGADMTRDELNHLSIPGNQHENAKVIMERLTYEIGEAAVDGETATVQTVITNVDLAAVSEKALLDLVPLSQDSNFQRLSKTEQNKKVLEVFAEASKQTSKTVTTVVDIRLKKVNNRWLVQMDETLSNAILGGNSGLLNA